MSNPAIHSSNSKISCTSNDSDSKTHEQSQKKPFVHWYKKNNLKVSEFEEAHSNMIDLIKEYEECEISRTNENGDE